jgi:hypothetical protein
LTDFNSVKNQTPGVVKNQSYELFEYEMNLASLIEKSDKMKNADDDQEMTTEDPVRRCNFELGDFSFESDGSINVIVTNRDSACPVYIFKVN